MNDPLHRRFVIWDKPTDTFVAEGVSFSDGRAAVHWTAGPHRSTVAWESLDALRAISGSAPGRYILWVDEPYEKVDHDRTTRLIQYEFEPETVDTSQRPTANSQ